MKRLIFYSVTFSLMLGSFTILFCGCSFMPKQINKIGRLGLQTRCPECPTKLEYNTIGKPRREMPHLDATQKDFPKGDEKRRIRRNMESSRDSQQPEDNGMENWNENVTSASPPESPSSTTPLPTLSNEDINITMLCQDYWFSCRGRCTRERELGGTEERLQCFCDSSCEMFQDCCADFDQFCSSSGTASKESKNPDYEQWKCVESESLTEALGVWMIASCPSNWTEEDIDYRCISNPVTLSHNNHKDNLPVIDRKGNTYKNHYCAQCHGLNLNGLLFYNLQFNCDVTAPKDYQSDQILKFLFTFCDKVSWQSPEDAARRYCHRLVPKDECSDCFPPTKVQQKCLAGPLRVVYVNDITMQQNFFNPYCALAINATNFVCGPGSSKPRPGREEPGPLPKPFSLVMDVDFSGDQPDKETSNVRKHKVVCLEGYVYDFYLQMCRPSIAPSDFNSLREKLFSVSVWMQSNISSSLIPLVTEINFKETIINNFNINETLLSVISIGNPSGPVSTVVFNIKINPAIQKNLTVETIKTAMSSLSMVLNKANYTVFKVAVKRFNCALIENYNPHEYTFKENEVKIRDTGKIFQEADYYTDETEWINGSLVPIGILTVCKQPQLNCSGVLVGLNENEYDILSNGSLYRNISREVFEPGRFLLINDTVLVCTNFSSVYESGRKTNENNIVLALVTFIGLSVSIISFAAVLVTFALFRELRTLPGINLMNLSFAHLVTDWLYLATGYIEAKVACTIIAILLHYFFLVSLTWMSIMAFEMWLVFSKICIQHTNPRRRKICLNLVRRIMIGWLPAFAFVVVCVALDQSNVVAFHYGGIKGCWINNSSANLYFFVIPVAFSMTFNTVFFVLTVRAIKITDNQSRRATFQIKNRTNAIVFLKIFILMGFTWIFGVLKALVSKYFEYPFIIFTTLQGLYVAMAFVFTSRVKKMYCTLLCIENNSANRLQNTLRTKREFFPPVVLLSHVEKNEK
ncbi:uncharacterized protein LOC144645559 [Oculina patagonica]